jgi:hypothetical protein
MTPVDMTQTTGGTGVPVAFPPGLPRARCAASGAAGTAWCTTSTRPADPVGGPTYPVRRASAPPPYRAQAPVDVAALAARLTGG